jgi:hypothetical protein
MRGVKARDLIGRKIVAVDLDGYRDPSGYHTRPVLTLDNGRRLSFVVSETFDGDEYGVSLCLSPSTKQRNPTTHGAAQPQRGKKMI